MNQNELKMLIALQPMIKKAVGEYVDYTEIICTAGERVHVCIDCNYACPNIIRCDCPHRILIPQTIDRDNRQWGLVGMLRPEGYAYLRNIYNLTTFLSQKNPTEAILKALCEQEGVKP